VATVAPGGGLSGSTGYRAFLGFLFPKSFTVPGVPNMPVTVILRLTLLISERLFLPATQKIFVLFLVRTATIILI
jgi:hypothetical protein